MKLEVTHQIDPLPKKSKNGSTYFTLTVYCNGNPVKDIHYKTYHDMCMDANNATAIIAQKIQKGQAL